MDSQKTNKKFISILGSTGSIGRQTLEIVQQFNTRFEVVGLTAGKNLSLFKEQLIAFQPKIAAVADKDDIAEIAQFISEKKLPTTVVGGKDGLIQVATQAETQLLVVAIVGTASLIPAYEAVKNGISIGLACKEVLVAAGDLFMNLAKEKNVPILPIDSEHAAIKQCLAGISEEFHQEVDFFFGTPPVLG